MHVEIQGKSIFHITPIDGLTVGFSERKTMTLSRFKAKIKLMTSFIVMRNQARVKPGTKKDRRA